ncbi:MAG: aldo/keto reductase [Gemmatimonadaceae bacterium]|nr:aldo/keto reductase [Gemmatimonadaceae bacterium]
MHAFDGGEFIAGRATPEGTRRFADRFAGNYVEDFYRAFGPQLLASSIGMGTYLGLCDDDEDARYVKVLSEGLTRGLNLLDTAINYRCQRSERAVGRAVRAAIESGAVARDEIILCTKGGYVPLEGKPPESRHDYTAYLKHEFFDHAIMDPSDVIAGGHCLTPRFLDSQIEASLANLGVACIDVYYLHNPEQQLETLGEEQFTNVMRAAFTGLEKKVSSGAIGVYGCATWSGFRVFAANRNHLSLSLLSQIAEEVGGKDHHFRIVQLPVNLAMPEGIRAPTQQADGSNSALLPLAGSMGISVVASASLMQSQLTHDLPPGVRSLFPGMESDAQRAIAFVRSLPLSCALVGMRAIDHLEENLGAGRVLIPS